MLLLFLVTLVPLASAYNCTEEPLVGCWFEESQLFDGNCNCGGCEDETWWNCENCDGGCPTVCGEIGECGTAMFVCSDGCEIFPSYVNDDWCDCPLCDEEDDWDCASCGSCPTECGGYTECVAVTTTPIPDYQCDDNCTIAGTKLNDGFCDCVVCEDEDDFTCESCGGCPADCEAGGFDCGVTTEAPETTAPPFTCDDGCVVDLSYVDDDWCDCITCEDETAWTCASCGGCPTFCGGYTMCSVQPTTSMAPFETSTSTTTEEPTEAEDGVAALRLLLAAAVSLLSAMAL